MLNKQRFFVFLTALLAFLPFFVLFYWPSNKLQLIACDVGQGDALLLTQGFNQLLIDGGPDGRVLDCLADNLPFWDKEIELVVNTHPDKDHLAGLVDVIERYSVKYLVSNSLKVETNLFAQFQQLVLEKDIPLYSPQKGDKLKIGQLELTVLWPQEKIGDSRIWDKKFVVQEKDIFSLKGVEEGEVLGKKRQDTNDYSIVFHLQFGQFDALLTGDITSQVEKEIIKNNKFKGIEVLKVAHHGSKYSTSEEFLQAVKPEIAIISVGKNPWGHPTAEVLERLKEIGAQVWRTDKQEVSFKI